MIRYTLTALLNSTGMTEVLLSSLFHYAHPFCILLSILSEPIIELLQPSITDNSQAIGRRLPTIGQTRTP